MTAPHILAAVDLGSNSFRLEIGRVAGNLVYLVDTLREPVRLASGLTRDKQLDRDAQSRGLAAIERFGERLRGLDSKQVRAVATNTLRVARNAREFLRAAEARLGFPIEVIGGREEARLVYSGVAHLLAPGSARRLVVDIGGGSTEVIVGTGYSPEIMESAYIGCVSSSLKFFADRYERSSFKHAELAARREFEVVSKPIRNRGWSEAIGSSGTARALAELIELNGFGAGSITLEGLERLKAALIKAANPAGLRLNGLKPDRIPVLPGGLSIMLAAFAEFGMSEVRVSEGGLRTGVLYDLLGRANNEDMRDLTVREFMRRYQVDEQQASRVAALASALWRDLIESKAPPESKPHDDAEHSERLLNWASLLHEIGLSISHNGYHKHSAYILSNADMPGFSRKEQGTLAALALGQTGKLPKLKDLIEAEEDWRLVVCLRLAALLYRSRNDAPLPAIHLVADRKSYALQVPKAWLEGNPLTEYDLRQEVEEWRRVGKTLELAANA